MRARFIPKATALMIAMAVSFSAHAETQRPMSTAPAMEVQELQVPDMSYLTFPLEAPRGGGNGGCLWRMPPVGDTDIEAFAALSLVPVPQPGNVPSYEAALQIAGAQKGGKTSAASFKSLRLTAGDDFDSDKNVLKKEEGFTARVTMPPVQATVMVTAIAEHGAALFFTTADGKKYERALPRPQPDEATAMLDCIEKAQTPPAKEPGDKK
jgi:hypothetical protein